MAFALIAASSAGTALRLGVGMLFLQFAIGVANDLADSTTDAQVKPHKPIPAGLVSRNLANGVFAVAAALGLVITATVGPATFALGAVGLADGLLYDLRLKGTAFGWAPFSLGVGLLPVYAWSGASGALPVAVPWVVALAVAAGCALALANAFSDLEDDSRSGVASIATVLGPGRTLALNAAILAAVDIVASATTVAVGAATSLVAVELGGAVLAWLGLGFAGLASARRRHLVWEVQALGILVLGVGWLAVMGSAGLLRP